MPGIRDFSAVVREIAGVVKAHVASALQPLADRIKSLEDRQPERGEKGEQGPPGKDAEPVVLADVVAELVRCHELQPVLALLVAEGVAEYLKANPPKNGRDGADGKDGERGPQGEKGADGRDGVGLADALIDRDGSLVLTLTDGRTKSLGPVVGKDGRDGERGQDGLSMADVARTYDAEAHEVVERWTVAGEAKELRYPAGGIRPGGFYREGMKCHAGQVFTHDGHAWVAKRDTAAKPCLENADDWQLFVRKGRDGRDGKDGKPPPSGVPLTGGGDGQ